MRTKEMEALLGWEPARCETWLFERVSDSQGSTSMKYTRRIDFKTCQTLAEYWEYLASFFASAHQDGWDVCLWVDGQPITYEYGDPSRDWQGAR